MQEKELSCGQVFAIFGVLALIGVFLWQMPASKDASDEWAAWVQAFGSIAAIAGAFFIADAARRHDTAERRAADRERAIDRGRVGYALAREASKTFQEAATKLRNHRQSSPFQPETRRFEQIVDLLQHFITGDCPPQMAADLIWLQGQVAHALEHLKQLDGLMAISAAEVKQFKYRHERAQKTTACVRLSHFRIRATNRN